MTGRRYVRFLGRSQRAPESREGESPGQAAAGGLGLKAAATAAAVTAVIGAILSPSTFGAVGRLIRGSDDAPPKAAAIVLERKSVPSEPITVLAPTTWLADAVRTNMPMRSPATAPGYADIDGNSITVAPGSGTELTDTRLVVGAATLPARIFRLDLSSRSATLRKLLEAEDWTDEGCTLIKEGPISVSGTSGVQSLWKGCNGIAEQRLFLAELCPPDGEFLVELEFTHVGDITAALQKKMIDSIVIDHSRIT